MIRIGRTFEYEDCTGKSYIDVEINLFQCSQCQHRFAGFVRVHLTLKTTAFLLDVDFAKIPRI